jgi:hypothetical protein
MGMTTAATDELRQGWQRERVGPSLPPIPREASLAGLFLRGSRTPAFRAGVPGCVPGAVSSSIAPPITLDIITFVPIDRLSTLLRLILGGADAGTWKRNNSAKA